MYKKRLITVVKALFILLLIGLLVAILSPILFLHRERLPSRRNACVNNLKQLGLVLNLYATENKDRYPPIDLIKNNFMFEGDLLYPEYLTDSDILVCPSDADCDPNKNFRLISNKYHPDASPGNVHPDCLTDISYCYLGWAVMDDSEAETFFEAYDDMMPKEYDRKIIVADGKGNAGGNTFFRLSMGVDRFFISDTNNAIMDDRTMADSLPIIWDKPSTDLTTSNHVPAGQNVLYLDGHVSFHRYDPNSGEFPYSQAAGQMFDDRPRDPIPDCE